MKQYKPRDKVTQKITREGAVEENQTTGKSENISGKEKEADFSGRLHFTEEDRAMPELDRYIRKAEQAADKAEAARERIPKKKKLTRERLYDEAKSKGKTKLRFKEVEKPMSEVEKTNPVSRPASLAGRMITGKAHGKIHEVEKENSGVEAGLGCPLGWQLPDAPSLTERQAARGLAVPCVRPKNELQGRQKRRHGAFVGTVCYRHD